MNEQFDLLPDDSGPSETFVRFDDLDAFYARCRLEHTRCIIQSLDRKRHGYVCVVMAANHSLPSPQQKRKYVVMQAPTTLKISKGRPCINGITSTANES